MARHSSNLLCLLALSVLTISATSPPQAPQPATLACTLVLLKTGPRTEPLSDEERTTVFAGHFANMERLAREGHLLVAGPYGEERSDPMLRGIFVLDTGDRAEAERLAGTDPGFRAGVFALEYHGLVTTAPLREYLAAEMAAADADAAAGRKREPGEGGRSFVLLQGDGGEQALAALAGHPAVLFAARLDETRAFALLDAADPAAARTLLAPIADRLGTITLDSWFGSSRLTGLRDPASLRR
jgi:uncharacterized protein YciI